VVNTLLQSLDARNGTGITLAATNHEHLLDTAVWRRFDARIEMLKPDEEAREQLLKFFLKPMRLKPSELRFLLWATDGMSGADIEMLVDAGKRFFVLHSSADRPSTVLEGLRRQAALNARLFSADRAALLTGPAEALDGALEQVGMTQADRGAVLGLSQSAVSRLRKRGEAGEAQKDAVTYA